MKNKQKKKEREREICITLACACVCLSSAERVWKHKAFFPRSCTVWTLAILFVHRLFLLFFSCDFGTWQLLTVHGISY